MRRFFLLTLIPFTILSFAIPLDVSNVRYWAIMGAGLILSMASYVDGWQERGKRGR